MSKLYFWALRHKYTKEWHMIDDEWSLYATKQAALLDAERFEDEHHGDYYVPVKVVVEETT